MRPMYQIEGFSIGEEGNFGHGDSDVGGNWNVGGDYQVGSLYQIGASLPSPGFYHRGAQPTANRFLAQLNLPGLAARPNLPAPYRSVAALNGGNPMVFGPRQVPYPMPAPPAVYESEPTEMRGFPLGVDSVTTIAAAATSNVTTVPQVPFRVERLVVPTAIASAFVINDIKVGKNSQLVNASALPAQMFTETAVGVRLKGDTCQVGGTIAINVTNEGLNALRFLAGIIGTALQ